MKSLSSLYFSNDRAVEEVTANTNLPVVDIPFSLRLHRAGLLLLTIEVVDSSSDKTGGWRPSVLKKILKGAELVRGRCRVWAGF